MLEQTPLMENEMEPKELQEQEVLTPPEEAPAEETQPDAVNNAMAELYPEASQKAEDATYTRRRKGDNA